MSVAFGTIVTKSYLPFARVLARSLREHHPEVPTIVVLADEVEGRFDPGGEPFELLPIEALGIPNLRDIRFRYSGRHVTIVAKPYLLGHLLDRGFDAAIFLDADILVLDELAPLLTAAEAHAIVLTPHLLGRLSGDQAAARELNILQSGVYNGGCFSVSECAEARRFLSWLGTCLQTHCLHDVAHGIHFDQRWLDLVPSFFEDVCILRDARCNVAYWNLPERYERVGTGGRTAFRFFHFSGFDPDQPRTVSRYSRRFAMETIGPAEELFEGYTELLDRNGHEESRTWPYTYDRFDNGVPIPALARRIHLEMGASANTFGNPFHASGAESYFRWLSSPADSSHGAVTRFWHVVYRSRPDLQSAFPDVFGRDYRRFLDWIVTHGRLEHAVDEAFTDGLTTHNRPFLSRILSRLRGILPFTNSRFSWRET
ncbi:MAG: hypothetical protein ND807_03770 [Vicinamibacterales bacterium]|nr:hypothetical protein [Vicinamibacterales bacterium]